MADKQTPAEVLNDTLMYLAFDYLTETMMREFPDMTGTQIRAEICNWLNTFRYEPKEPPDAEVPAQHRSNATS